MKHIFEYIAALSLISKLAYSVLGVVVIRNVFRRLEQTLLPHFADGDRRYRVRKMVTASTYIIIVIFIAVLFADRLRHVGLAAGLSGAGIVVALQDMIASFGGFVAIEFFNLYRVGDRIQVKETKGDVLDISVMRTTIMETGNWVSRDLYNGRTVHVPNSAVLKALVFNYSQGFRFVRDEIKIRLAPSSDHQRSRAMLLRVAKDTLSEYLAEAQGSWKRLIENYRIENRLLEPTITLQARDGSLEFSLSYIVDYTKRTMVKDQLFTKIVDEIANSKGRMGWASSSTTVLLQSAPPICQHQDI